MFLALQRAAATLSAVTLCICASPLSAQPRSVASLDEEVRFASDPGTMLAGTLAKPSGLGAGPFPVVVIVAGTGPWKRGGWANIRARLLASGIATLTYDKRGQGQSTGAFIDTLPAMERDVTASVAFLRSRPDVDRRRIALLGTSQGAVAAPMVASRDPAVAAVVMLSGPVGSRGELFLGILRGHLKQAGKNPAQIETVAGAVGAWMASRSRSAGAAEIARHRTAAEGAFATVGFPRPQAAAFIVTLDDDVVLSMFEAAPDEALAKLRVPVLAIYGSEDDVIAPALSIEAAVAALSNNQDAMVIAIPGMNHVLSRAIPAATNDAIPEDGTMPVVTDVVGDWLGKRLRTPSAKR